MALPEDLRRPSPYPVSSQWSFDARVKFRRGIRRVHLARDDLRCAELERFGSTGRARPSRTGSWRGSNLLTFARPPLNVLRETPASSYGICHENLRRHLDRPANARHVGAGTRRRPGSLANLLPQDARRRVPEAGRDGALLNRRAPTSLPWMAPASPQGRRGTAESKYQRQAKREVVARAWTCTRRRNGRSVRPRRELLRGGGLHGVLCPKADPK